MDAGVRGDDAEQLPARSQVNAALTQAPYLCIRETGPYQFLPGLYIVVKGSTRGFASPPDHGWKKRSALSVDYRVVPQALWQRTERPSWKVG